MAKALEVIWAKGSLPFLSTLPFGLALLTACLSPAVFARQAPEPVCTVGEANRAVETVPCLSPEQFEAIDSYRNVLTLSKVPPDQHTLREILVTAQQAATCVNNLELFPLGSEEKEDFHCLQRNLLEFYRQVAKPETEAQLFYQDRLAFAATRIHYCMLDEELPAFRCLDVIQEGLDEYRAVFQEAAAEWQNMLASPQPTDPNEEEPVPPVNETEFRSFIDLSIQISERYPRLLGTLFGEALGPVLCSGYQLYPESREYIIAAYNVLIRFDFKNLGSSAYLYRFLQALERFLQPAPGVPTFLELVPADWSPSPQPCAEEDWIVSFPEFQIRRGFRLPDLDTLKLRLERLSAQLVEVAALAESRNQVWKPFLRYGQLLMSLSESLKASSLRYPEVWEFRHLLMAMARDAFILRNVDVSKHPLDMGPLQEAMGRQIDGYGQELLNDVQFRLLIDFGESYLEAGEGLLTEAQERQLHRYLAIAYAVEGDQSRSIASLEESDLDATRLEQAVKSLTSWGLKAGANEEQPQQ